MSLVKRTIIELYCRGWLSVGMTARLFKILPLKDR